MKRKVFIVSTIVFLFGASAAIWLIWREQQEKPLPELENPRLVVRKSKRRLLVFDNEKLVKTYRIVLGASPAGDKVREGDGRTPEGEFTLAVKNPDSKFFLSLGLNYPNTEDAARGLETNLISQNEYDEILRAVDEKRMPPQKTALGGEIYIHGGGTAQDWTEGCVALENRDIEELFNALPPQISVRIEP